MGNCDACIPPPATAAQERLKCLTYNRWREFAQDLILGYGNLQLKFTIDMDLRLDFADGTQLVLPHRIGFNDYVIWSNLQFTRKVLTSFMSAPYYYIDSNIHFYNNVSSCKYFVIKNFVIIK